VRTFIIIFFLLPFYTIGQKRYADDIFTATSVETYEYSNKENEPLQLDFYKPENDNLKDRALIVFVHGGGFSTGKRDDSEIKKLAKAFTRKGYVVASVSYRLTRKGKGFGCDTPATIKKETFKNAGEDVLDAICFLIDKKEQFNIDPLKIILAGSSAGAEAALAITYNKHLYFKNSIRYNHISPVAMVSLAGALIDVHSITKKNAVPGIFFHGTEDPLVPYKSAPHHYCDAEKPGYLILHGSKTITDKLKQLDSSYLLYTIQGAKHNIFEITDEKLSTIFNFLNEVVIKEKKYQKSIIY